MNPADIKCAFVIDTEGDFRAWTHATRTVRFWYDEDAQNQLFEDAAEAIADAGVIGARTLLPFLEWASPERKPEMLWIAWRTGKLIPHVLTELIGRIWRLGGAGPALTHEQWRAMFAAAGYTYDGHAVPRPRTPVELWRGASDEHRGGMFWTSYREYAERYAQYRETARLWRTVAPPEALLCRNVRLTNQWDEFAVDTRGLAIEEIRLPGPAPEIPAGPRPDHIPAHQF